MAKTFLLNDLTGEIRSGDIDSFEKLYRMMGEKVYRYAYSFLPCREDAEEIVHDVFIKIWEKRHTLKDNKSLQAFLYTITKNLTLDKIRKYSVDTVNLEQYFQNEKSVEAFDEGGPSDKLIELVNQLVEEMPYQRKKIFKLNKFEGMSQKSISEYLNISQGTVEKHISKAYRFLKEELDKRQISTYAIFFIISLTIFL